MALPIINNEDPNEQQGSQPSREANSESEEDPIQHIMEEYEEPQDQCVSHRHPNPRRNRMPSGRTVDAHEWLSGQSQAYDCELTEARNAIRAQDDARRALGPIKELYNEAECFQGCQHEKAVQECELLDLATVASEKLQRACELYDSALNDIKHYLCIRTYRQKHFTTPFQFGPLPLIPDTGNSLSVELDDDSFDASGASTDDAAE